MILQADRLQPSDRFSHYELHLFLSVLVKILEQLDCKQGEIYVINGDPLRQHKIALLNLFHNSLVLLLLLTDKGINAWFAFKSPISINLLSTEEVIKHFDGMSCIHRLLHPSHPAYLQLFLIFLDKSCLLPSHASLSVKEPIRKHLSKTII